MSTTRSAFATSPNRVIGTVCGSIYLLLGLLGFFWAEGTPFAGPGNGSSNLMLGLFTVNPLHNAIHLVAGAALLLCGLSTAAAARATNTAIGAVLLLVGIVGFIIAAPDGGHSAANFLSVNTADQVLHLVSAIVLLAVGIGADRHLIREAPALAS